MDRCHLYLPLVDPSGTPYQYAEVTLLDQDGSPIDAPVYLEPTGGAPQTWPVLIDPAVINLWTDTPMRVTVLAALPGGATLTRAGVDITPAPAATLRSEEPLRIASADGLDGSALLAVSPDGSAGWQVMDVLRFHRHDGDAPDSTMVGMPVLSDIYPRQTWIGAGTGAPSASQGADSVALGEGAQVTGDHSVAVGRSSAATRAVAAGGDATARDNSVALGVSTSASGTAGEQVAIGQGATTAAAGLGAVAMGSGAVVPSGWRVAVSDAVKTHLDGTVIVGRGTPPDTTGLTGSPFLTMLGNVVAARYFGARKNAVLAGAGSQLGFYGGAGGLRPMLNTSGVTSATPGKDALLSLMSALDQLGLIYQTDVSGVIDDDLADWTKAYAHDANLVFDTPGDASGYFAGDGTRIKRNTSVTSAVTYYLASGIRDFTVKVFTSSPVDVTTEVTAQVSLDGTTWTTVPLAFQPLVTTVSPWQQTWASNARALLFSKYLKLSLGVNTLVYAPQIGRVIVRPSNGILTGYGSGGYGQTPYGG